MKHVSRVLVVGFLLAVAFGVAGLAQQGDYMVCGFRGDPGSLDPAATSSTDYTWFLYFQIYEQLCKLDGDAQVVPVLATSWDINEAGDEYVFHLRKGVTFHDGSTFNADAVRYSFERIFAVNMGPGAWMQEHVGLPEVIDEYTVKFTLKHPYETFPGLLASLMGGAYIVSPTAFRANATDNDPWAVEWARSNAIGSGPYKLDEWIHGQFITLSKNEGYWKGWGGEHFDGILFRVVRETSSRVLGLMAGTLDFAIGLNYTDVPPLEADPGVEVNVVPSSYLYMITLNTQRPPLNNVKVREAISWACPYEGIGDTIFLGHANRSVGPLHSIMEYHNPDCFQYTEDLDKARAALAESGIDPGAIPMELYYCAGVDVCRRINEALQANLTKLGFDVQIKSAPWATLFAVFSGEKDPEKRPHMGFWITSPDYDDPFTQVFEILYESTEVANWAGYDNQHFDALLAQAYQTADTEEQRRIAYEMQDMLIRDVINIHTYEGTVVASTRADVKGYYTNVFYFGLPYVYDMWRE